MKPLTKKNYNKNRKVTIFIISSFGELVTSLKRDTITTVPDKMLEYKFKVLADEIGDIDQFESIEQFRLAGENNNWFTTPVEAKAIQEAIRSESDYVFDVLETETIPVEELFKRLKYKREKAEPTPYIIQLNGQHLKSFEIKTNHGDEFILDIEWDRDSTAAKRLTHKLAKKVIYLLKRQIRNTEDAKIVQVSKANNSYEQEKMFVAELRVDGESAGYIYIIDEDSAEIKESPTEATPMKLEEYDKFWTKEKLDKACTNLAKLYPGIDSISIGAYELKE